MQSIKNFRGFCPERCVYYIMIQNEFQVPKVLQTTQHLSRQTTKVGFRHFLTNIAEFGSGHVPGRQTSC